MPKSATYTMTLQVRRRLLWRPVVNAHRLLMLGAARLRLLTPDECAQRHYAVLMRCGLQYRLGGGDWRLVDA